METKTVVNQAVDQINEQRTKAAQSRAAILLENINAEKKSAEANEAIIVAKRAEIGKVNQDTVTVEGILGGVLPTTVNSETILKVVDEMNKGRQARIANQIRELAQALFNAQDAIRMSGERIAKYREEVLKLQPELVTAAELGA